MSKHLLRSPILVTLAVGLLGCSPSSPEVSPAERPPAVTTTDNVAATNEPLILSDPSVDETVTDPRSGLEFQVETTTNPNAYTSVTLLQNTGALLLHEAYGEKMGQTDGAGVEVFYGDDEVGIVEVRQVSGGLDGGTQPTALLVPRSAWLSDEAHHQDIVDPLSGDVMGELTIQSDKDGNPTAFAEWAVSEEAILGSFHFNT